MKIDKVPAVELIRYAQKVVKQEYIENAKELFAGNVRGLMDVLKNSTPKGDELLDLCDDWMKSIDGSVSLLIYAIKKHNPEKSDAEIKEYVEALELKDIIAKIGKVWGVDEVEQKKE